MTVGDLGTRLTWRYNVELDLTKSGFALQIIVVYVKAVGSLALALLNILIVYQRSMYMSMKSKLTNLVLTT